MNANRLYRFLLCFLIMFQLMSTPVWSQGVGRDILDRRSSVRASLDYTQELIDRAAESIQSCDNPAAAVALEQGRSLLGQANERFSDDQVEVAAKLALLARDRVKAALSACRSLEEDETNVQRRLDRAQDLLDRAAELVSGTADGPIASLLESARNNLARAWEFYQNREFRPALKLANQVEIAAKKILGMRNSATKEENLELRLENAEQALDQARQSIAGCDDNAAANLLSQAEKALVLARELGDKGQYASATAAANNARELALKAQRRCESDNRLTTRYEQLRTRADQLQEQALQLEGNQRTMVEEQIAQIYGQLDMAKVHLAEGNRVKAEASLQAAQLLIRQIETALK